MKRRAPVSPPPASSSSGGRQEGGPRRRRQPQTSCNFCRSKKLKCDRAQPCSNCTSRGIPCEGQSVPVSSAQFSSGPGPHAGTDIIERLRRLEDAVFGPSPAPDRHHASGPPYRSSTTEDALSPSSPKVVRDQSSSEFDYHHVGESMALDDCDTFTFRVTSSGQYNTTRHTSVRCIDLPSKEDALAMFNDYRENTDFHVANVLHPPTVQAMIGDVYTQLRLGQRVDLGPAAFVLSFCAASAFFWDTDFSAQFSFSSEDNAAAQSHAWRSAAWDLLDQAQRAACNTLQVIQARLILGDLIYNIEGVTSRFRYLHSCARVSAYEMRLHMVDFPGCGAGDSALLREMKRRLWWYLAATDWLLCSMCSNMDRAYTVHPRHMRVNYPSHVVGPDQFNPSHGPWSEASLVHMTVRIRLAEICRETVDALPLGSDDIDALPYSIIAALDRQYQQLLVAWPTLGADLSSPDPVARRIASQRSTGILSVHARRARLLRPLLQSKSLPEKFKVFRKTCLDSAEAVIDIATTVLSEAVDTPSSSNSASTLRLRRDMTSQRSPHRSGLVISHLFMACAVLATDPSLRGGPEGGAPSGLDAETERRRLHLANACRLLEKAGKKSPMALSMMQRLVGVLRKHRVHGVEEGGGGGGGGGGGRGGGRREEEQEEEEEKEEEVRSAPNQGPGVETSIGPAAASCVASRDVSTNHHAQLPGQQQQQKQQLATTYPSGFGVVGQPQAVAQPWAYDTMDPNGMTGIWNDFLGTNPTDNGWDQLFADLDYLNSSI